MRPGRWGLKAGLSWVAGDVPGAFRRCYPRAAVCCSYYTPIPPPRKAYRWPWRTPRCVRVLSPPRLHSSSVATRNGKRRKGYPSGFLDAGLKGREIPAQGKRSAALGYPPSRAWSPVGTRHGVTVGPAGNPRSRLVVCHAPSGLGLCCCGQPRPLAWASMDRPVRARGQRRCNGQTTQAASAGLAWTSC